VYIGVDRTVGGEGTQDYKTVKQSKMLFVFKAYRH